MNERIRELWDQAAKSTAAFPTGQNNSWETQVNFIDKFAELIVQECLLSLEPDPMAPAINYDVEQKFYQRSADKIKQHFGVE